MADVNHVPPLADETQGRLFTFPAPLSAVQPAERLALVVLGMHRSGTSALTRIVGLLGAALPKTVVGSNSSNETGHWEPQPIVRLNDRILAAARSRWDDWRPLDLDMLSARQLASFRREIADIVAAEYGGAPLVVIKDPRLCRLAPIYEEALTEAGITPRFVIGYRNPLAVAASLADRNGMTPGFSALLWLRHVVDAEAATRGRPRSFVSYERLVQGWRGPVAAIAGGLELTWPRAETAASEIEGFLSAGLTHHWPDIAAMDRSDLPDWVKNAMHALERLAASPRDRQAQRELDRIKADFDAASRILGDPAFVELGARERRLTLQREEAQAGFSKQQAKTQQLRGEVASHQQGSEATAARLAEQDRQIVRLTAELEAAKSALAARQENTAENAAQARERERTIGQLIAEIDAMAATAAGRDRELADIRAGALAANDRRLAAASQELSERDREIGRLAAEAAALAGQAKAAESRIRSLTARLVHRERRGAELELKAQLGAAELAAERLARAEIAERHAELDRQRADLDRRHAEDVASLLALQGDIAALSRKLLGAEQSRREAEPGRSAHTDAEVNALRAELENAVARKRVREREVREHAEAMRELKRRLRAAERSHQALLNSTSWRITAPLRGLGIALHGAGRGLAGAVRMAGWLATGQFARAGRAALPAYHRLVPRPLRRLVPRPLAEGVQRALDGRPPVAAPAPVQAALAKKPDKPKADPAHHTSTYNERRPYAFPGDDRFREIEAAYRKAKGRNNRVVVFSAVAGGYDSVKRHEHLDPRFDYVLFTDGQSAIPPHAAFERRCLDYFDVEPTRSARFVKTHPHVLLGGYDVAIWVDGNIIIRGDIGGLVAAFRASGQALAAVPHPLRRSVYEEAAECLARRKDEADAINEQVARYEAEGFDCDNLVESNALMFNLRHPRIGAFLDGWWREIERGSRRDQLSLNHALHHAGLGYFPLTAPPNSIRNHPAFALLAHGGEAPAATAAALPPAASGPRYADVRDDRIARQKNRPIDIVICVHNALDDVRLCLESIERSGAGSRQRIVIVDDGSAAETATYLRRFAAARQHVKLRRNDTAVGYTRAANIGLGLGTGDIAILLNSDTVVTRGWAEKLADALDSTPGAGIVGPLSNAASHQSIPDHVSGREQTAVNDLPPGMSAEDVNRWCEQWSLADSLPRAPLAHGFCLGIRREVIKRVGAFDETNFPRGYGEENDFCLRATAAGFGIVVATHTFVYHAKSRSYASADRVELTRAGNARVRDLHGNRRVARAIYSMQQNPQLVRMRKLAQRLFENE